MMMLCSFPVYSKVIPLYTYCCSVTKSFLTLCNPWTAAHQASPSFTIFQSLLKLMSIELMMPFNYLVLRHPFHCLPSNFSSIRVFSSELALHIRWPKDLSFSFSIRPSSEYSGLISFRIDWFDPTLQGALKSLLQHHNSKVFILPCSAFFRVQRLHHCWEMPFNYLILCHPLLHLPLISC